MNENSQDYNRSTIFLLFVMRETMFFSAQMQIQISDDWNETGSILLKFTQRSGGNKRMSKPIANISRKTASILE